MAGDKKTSYADMASSKKNEAKDSSKDAGNKAADKAEDVADDASVSGDNFILSVLVAVGVFQGVCCNFSFELSGGFCGEGCCVWLIVGLWGFSFFKLTIISVLRFEVCRFALPGVWCLVVWWVSGEASGFLMKSTFF